MKMQISIAIAAALLIFAITSAQQQNQRRDDGDKLSQIYEIGSDRTQRQVIMHQKSKVFELRNHRSATAHYVNTSKPSTHESTTSDNALVKVYGEANPSKTDEKLMDVEANTRIINVNNGLSSLPPTGKGVVHNLSVSGYGSPEEELQVTQTDKEIENVKKVQTVLCPEVENPYGGGVLNEETLAAETQSTNNGEEREFPSSINGKEDVIISEEAASNKNTEAFMKTVDVTESEVSNVEQVESTITAYKTFTESLTETNEESPETVTEQNEASTDYREGDKVSPTGASKGSYDVNIKELGSTSVDTDATEMSTTENMATGSAPEEYGPVLETEKAEAELKTNENSNEDTGMKSSESVKESLTTTEDIMHTLQTDAERLRYEAACKFAKFEQTAEKSTTTTSENLTKLCKAAAHDGTGSPVSSKAAQASGDIHQNQESTTANGRETHLSETMEVTSPVTSDTPADNLYTTENTSISKVSTSSVVESEEGISGYECQSKADDTVTGNKTSLLAQYDKSPSQQSKLTILCKTSEEAESETLESTVANWEDLKSSEEPSGKPQETSSKPAQQSPARIAEQSNQTEVQKTNERVEASHDVVSGTNKEVVPDNTSVTSSDVSATSGVVNVAKSTTAMPQSKCADAQTAPVDLGYGDSSGKDDGSPDSVSTTISDDTTENPCSRKPPTKLSESVGANDKSTVAANGIMAPNVSEAGYDAIGNEAITESEIVGRTIVSTQETSEGILASESPESEAFSSAASESKKPTETATSETASVEAESKENLKDMIDFAYGGGAVSEITEGQLPDKTEDSNKSETVAEPTLAKPVVRITDEAEDGATVTSPEIKTDFILESTDTSQQHYSTKVIDTATASSSSSTSNEATGSIGVAGRTDGAVASESYLQQITGSTLMHVIANGLDTSIPCSISEEAPKVIAMTKVTQKGPSKLVGDIIASTKGAENGEEGTSASETSNKFQVGSKATDETDDTLPESPPAVATATDIGKSEFHEENTEHFPGEGVPTSLEASGYGTVNELSELTSNVESVATTMEKLSSKNAETSIAVSDNAYVNFEAVDESEAKVRKGLDSTASSATSSTLANSYGEANVVDEDKRSTSQNFGYDVGVMEISSSAMFTSTAASKEQKQEVRSIVSNEVSSGKSSREISNSSGRKWRPFTIDCDAEVDEKGDRCQGWARAGLCDGHRPTMFLFCRRTCLCVGPPAENR